MLLGVSMLSSCERKHDSIVWKPCIVQRGFNERSSVGVSDTGRCCEIHSAPPLVGRFRMDPAKYHPPLPRCSFDDRGRAVGVLADDGPPTCKLWAIFPIMF